VQRQRLFGSRCATCIRQWRGIGRGVVPSVSAHTLTPLAPFVPHATRIGLGLRRAMRCVACGAEMRLVGVSLTDTPMAGFERHTFKCSTCSHISRRLVLSPKTPVVNLPLVGQHPEPPAVPSVAQDPAAPARTFNWVEDFEKHRSQYTPIQGRAATARIASTLKAVKKRPSPQARAQEASAPPRTSTWPETVEKVRRQQSALQANGNQSRATAADAYTRGGNKRPSRTWAEVVEELQRRQAALSERAASSIGAEPAEPGRASGASSER
jgi:hypothetical protein